MKTVSKVIPELDPEFAPAALWNKSFQAKVAQSKKPQTVLFTIIRPDGTGSRFTTEILPLTSENSSLNLRYLERTLKFLLWQRGGNEILITGCDALTPVLASLYSEMGARKFDHDFMGEKAFRSPLQVSSRSSEQVPYPKETPITLGRHLDGCRIGFDHGGSDRKCAAVMNGEVVFSQEIIWNPYFEEDASYHLKEINDSLKQAAAHLPRVDAIGGSCAGIYVNNEVRVASLFRGLSPEQFESEARSIFSVLKRQWGDLPFEVVNDGEVTALAGSMNMKSNAVLGIAMGTSEAVGYIDPNGNITPMLNELAFAPIDYRPDAPIDEWSGDRGCGVQYLSQQAVARLIPATPLQISSELPFAEQLVKEQEAMAQNNEHAAKIYRTIGVYLGYAIAHYAHFYQIEKILLLGRVTSGQGGNLIQAKAEEVLSTEFPALAQQIEIVIPDELEKRHGQAVAAASLPSIL